MYFFPDYKLKNYYLNKSTSEHRKSRYSHRNYFHKDLQTTTEDGRLEKKYIYTLKKKPLYLLILQGNQIIIIKKTLLITLNFHLPRI